jgi:serine/threonine-protein kinase
LLAKLATGGMAEIWLARQVGLRGFERIVVVKRIIESLSQDESFVEMFLDEARIVVQLTHPNIVQVFDLGQHAGAYYIAMEYLPGENLVGVVRAAAKAGQPLSAGASVKIAIAALEGLAHAHARTGIDGQPLNVIHRDVSPHNIVLTWDGQVKLVDFGIARAANRSTQTQGNQLKGKFAYMAPEQASGEGEMDARVDVFAMGVVLWELVTHRRLFNSDDQIRILRTLMSDAPVEAAASRNPEVPRSLSDLIMKALQKNPDARYASAADFKAALEDWLRANGGGPTTAELSALMHGLFKARIAERSQLIENAARGEVSNSKVGEVMKPGTDKSMPDGTPSASLVAPPPNDNLKLVMAAAATIVLVVFAALAAWKVFFTGPVATPEPEPVAEVLPPPRPTPPEPKPVPVVPATVEKASSLVVETEPAGAQVTVDGKDVGAAPLTVNDVQPGEHVVEATLAGYTSVKRTVSASTEGDRLMVVLNLPQKKVEVSRGKLTLNTEPWTHVSLNGKALGDTPLIEVALPAGRHRLQLTNDQAKIDVAVEVEVKAGQLTKKSLRL